jgi:hypothetical protein
MLPNEFGDDRSPRISFRTGTEQAMSQLGGKRKNRQDSERTSPSLQA